jgi:hypothetical protein
MTSLYQSKAEYFARRVDWDKRLDRIRAIGDADHQRRELGVLEAARQTARDAAAHREIDIVHGHVDQRDQRSARLRGLVPPSSAQVQSNTPVAAPQNVQANQTTGFNPPSRSTMLPSANRSQARDSMRLDASNLEHELSRLLKTVNDRSDQTQNVVDESLEVDIRAGADEAFYDSLPAPWNVQPLKRTKRMDAQKCLTNAQIPFFKGEVAEYFRWRSRVIELIHKAPLTIAEKLSYMRKNCECEKNPQLRSIFSSIGSSPTTYKMTIGSLEASYGGELKAKTVCAEMLNQNTLVYNGKTENMKLIVAKVNAYLDTAASAGLGDLSENYEAYPKVAAAFLREQDEAKFVRYLLKKGNNRPNIGLFLEWLSFRVVSGDLVAYTGTARRAPKAQTAELSESSGQRRIQRHKPKGGVTLNTVVEESSDDEATEIVSVADDAGEQPAESDNEDRACIDVDCNVAAMPEWDGFCCLLNKATGTYQCPCCKDGNHWLFRCPKFINMRLNDRVGYVKTSRRCDSCLSTKHFAKNCKSDKSCKKCGKKHHTLLHKD